MDQHGRDVRFVPKADIRDLCRNPRSTSRVSIFTADVDGRAPAVAMSK
jgi:hypothetical protein